VISDQPEKQDHRRSDPRKLLSLLDMGDPHGTAVEITGFSERDDGIIDVDATIYAKKASHKGIIIGKKNGAMLQKDRKSYHAPILKRFDVEGVLKLWVKVKEGWRENLHLIRNFRI
jgi:GTP-binding protein Era